MKAKQGYFKGMNQDSAKNKRDPNSYYYMRDLRVVTEDGLSTGSLETEKGHLLGFVVPDIPEQVLTDGTIIPEQTNLRIIGWTTILDTIVLFTTNETIDNPTVSYGQVWKLKFDEGTCSVIGVNTSNELDINTHLVYNNQVNFSTANRIGRAVGRYETTNTQRVYWTDNYNAVRVLNIEDSDAADIDVTNLDLKPGITFTQPSISEIGVGSLPTGTMIQFAYRLLDTGGAETLFSPTSTLVPLIEGDFKSTDFGAFEGKGGVANKSVTYTIKGLDTDYDVIEHVAIVYTSLGVYTVYKFDEEEIPTTGEVEVICSSIDTAIQISTVEFNMLNSGFEVAKDIEVKDNRLVAANTKTQDFDIDYEARVYRFNSAQEALLKGTPDITLTGPAPVWGNVPNDHDAINLYNDESGATWFTDQYKFKSDGVTLGGEGQNISYSFTTIALPANTTLSRTISPDHISIDNYTAANPPFTHNVLEADSSNKEIHTGEQFRNFASQWAHSNYTGYSRGETYRFGIVFYGEKGSTTFVKWIGDIRFPDVEDGFPLQQEVNGIPTLFSLGIEFDVDITSVSDNITGYSIVRVKREEKDKTKLGSGLQMFFDIQDKEFFHSLAHRWETSGPNAQAANPNNPYEYTDQFNLYGVLRDSCYHLADKPGLQAPQLNFGASKRVTYLLSPIGQLYPYEFKNQDYIQTRGYYTSVPVRYAGDVLNPSDNLRSYGFYYKAIDFVTDPNPRERFQIGDARVLNVGEFIFENTDIINGYTGINGLRNASACKDLAVEGTTSHVPFGLGSPKVALMLDDTPSIIHNTGDPGNLAGDAGNLRYLGNNWTGPEIGNNDLPGFQDTIDFDGGETSITTTYLKEVVYARYVINQYGGNTFTDRSKNQYISTNHFQITKGLTPTQFNFEIYGGDTYVNYYDDEQIQYFWNQTTADKVPYKTPDVNKLSVAMCFPVESSVNTDYRLGRHWASSRDSAAMGLYENNTWSFLNVLTQENKTEEKFFDKDFLLNLTEEHPHQIWASESKIDGELIDSWRSFKIANTTEVNGVHGPINRLINFKDRLYFYQDKAFGIASIDERSIVTDESGQQITLGVGGVFPDYAYISTTTGTIHQFAVTATESSIYHYDARLRKMYAYSGAGSQPLSDVKGLSSFFDNNVQGDIGEIDKTLDVTKAIGVHAITDFRYNRVLFTFLSHLKIRDLLEFKVGSDYIIPANTYIDQNGTVFYFKTQEIIPEGVPPTVPNLIVLFPDKVVENSRGFTVSYNEFLGAYESFYSYLPGIYMEYGRRLLSVSPFENNKAFIHNEGPMATYYDQTPSTSILNTILGVNGNVNKIYNNISYKAELYSSVGDDIYNETLSSIRLYNEYQDTGLLNLNVTTDIIPAPTGDDIRRRMRTWRFSIPRDNTDGKSRIRNPWLHCEVTYDNNNDKRHVLHEIVYSYTQAPM